MGNTLAYALQAFDIITKVAITVSDVVDLWNEQRAKIQAMQDENRDPNSAEWNELFAMVQGNSDELQS